MVEFQPAAKVTEIPPGTGKSVPVGPRTVAIFNLGGSFHACQGICPHRGGPLGEGLLEGSFVTCPWHAWSFDVTTGHRHGFPEGMGKISTYPVKVEGDTVYVAL